MVRMKKIVMRFAKPLTEKVFYQGQEVTQEEILQADVEGIREKIGRELTKVLKSVNMVRILNPSVFKMMEYRIKGLEHELKNLVDFRKEDENTYVFIYPMDMTSLLTIKNVGLKLGLIKIKERDLEIAKVIREKELIEAFQKFSFVEMKLEPNSWQITTEEFEAETVGETETGGLVG